jgi:hypothetical protein
MNTSRERPRVFHLAHPEDRQRLQERPDAGADHLVADLRGVLPREDGLEPGRSALGQHLGDRRRQHVVGLVDEERHAALLGFGEALASLQGAMEELQQKLRHEHGRVAEDRAGDRD